MKQEIHYKSDAQISKFKKEAVKIVDDAIQILEMGLTAEMMVRCRMNFKEAMETVANKHLVTNK